jgi:hypothetical protein
VATGATGVNMENRQTRVDREKTLAGIEVRLVENSDDISLQFDRARLLTALGRAEDAKQAYLKILATDPRHLGTLNNLGTILYETGYRSAACTTYLQAVTHHPDDAISRVNLANLLFDENDLAAARGHYEEALRLEPDLAQAHQGMTRIYSALRDEAGASRHRERGFRNHAVSTLPYLGKEQPVKLLLLVSADGGNIPVRQHIDNHVFETTVVFADFYDQAQPLPLHDLVFNTIGDADLCKPALEAAARLLTKTNAPVINPPQKVLSTGRVDNARLLAGTGVKTAQTKMLLKQQVLQQKLDFPLLLRAPGFHTGQHFVKVDKPEQLARAMEQIPGEEILAMQYLDATSADGLARKYRVMMIDGKLYPLHLAISENWKVHYFTAAMSGHTLHQLEEMRFLEDMPGVLGAQGMAALERISKILGLDYGGVDFGLDRSGNILLFEANATMVINLPDSDPQWAYRRPAMEKALQAMRLMLARLARTATPKGHQNVL